MTAVDKRINQPVIEHHRNKVKLEQYFARTRLTAERWPRRRSLDGGAAGHEEERRRAAFPGEVKRPELVGWVRKEQAKLLRLCSDWKDTTATTQARRTNGGGIGKTEKTNDEKRRR